jgi:DNA repair protein RadC
MHGLVTNGGKMNASGHRARLLGVGAEAFQDYELIEYLLASPSAGRHQAAGQALLHDFGGIGPLLGASADTLNREGMSDATVAALKIAEATALRLLERRVEERPVLSSWDALCDYLHAAMAHSRTEQVRVLFPNAKNALIANEAMWDGSVDEAAVHVREVISRAIALGAGR